MLDALDRFDPSLPGARASLQRELYAHLLGIARTPRGDRSLLEHVEAEVRKAPAASFTFGADGHATLRAAGRTYHAGHFETPSIGELRRRAEDARERSGHSNARLRLYVMDGASPATDIGALQAGAPPGSLFQVASQFNCLESPSSFVVPVYDYFFDGTQGPRASISAFPGTLLRHYAAPSPSGDGSRFVQVTDGPELNLLEAVCAPDVAHVRSGYLRASTIASPARLSRALVDRFEDLRVGVHDAIEVVHGHDWLGPVDRAPDHRIAQVFTSTIAAGGYGPLDETDPVVRAIVEQLQRAAYTGTLLAAASLSKSHAVLTLIGGGVFGNPISMIWDAILWACDRVAPLLHRDLTVVVNGYALGRRVSSEDLGAATSARGGAVIVFDEESVIVR